MTITPEERAFTRTNCAGNKRAIALLDALEAAERELAACKAKLAALVEIHPFSEWSEDDGDVLWFSVPVCDPPFYVGRPDDSEWPFDNDPDGIPEVRIGWSRIPPVNADVAAAKEPTP